MMCSLGREVCQNAKDAESSIRVAMSASVDNPKSLRENSMAMGTLYDLIRQLVADGNYIVGQQGVQGSLVTSGPKRRREACNRSFF
jgi:hypothetical protein